MCWSAMGDEPGEKVQHNALFGERLHAKLLTLDPFHESHSEFYHDPNSGDEAIPQAEKIQYMMAWFEARLADSD